MHDYPTLIAGTLIISGAVVMLMNIIRFSKTIGVLNHFELSISQHLRVLGRVHQGLMVFFLIGYVAVAVAILADIAPVSAIFVGLIFLLGAIFVWLGIILQHRMIDLIQSRYRQASRAKADLETERARLESANNQLNSEIAERRRAESALRESETRLKFILDQIPSGILIIDETTMIVQSANPAALELLGLSVAEVIGAPYDRVVRSPQASTVSPIEAEIQMDRYRRFLIEANGQQVSILATFCRIELDGRPHLMECFIDISEKERLEDQLRRAQRMEALGTMAGGVAHDLNNILSGIVSYPELLIRDLPAESPMLRPLQTMKQSGEKATTIVQDMLTLARRGVVSTSVVSLKDAIRDYLQSPEHGRLRTYHPNVEFECRVEDHLLNIVGSPVHLTKTIMNLCSNAAEAMPKGGIVKIHAENRYVDRPLAGYDTVKEGDYAVLSVSDAGVGIPHEDRERIFEPFFTKKEMGRSGTGLGMAVVWGTVKDHRGYIHVESEPARGTKFTLYFPATRKGADAAEMGNSVEAYFGSGETILIVDDIGAQREIAIDMLKMLKYTPHAVESGEAALEYLRRNEAELILLDMIMDPGMGGLQTYREILKIRPGQRTLLVSGYSETDDVRQAQKLGAGPYVKKPYSFMELGKRIYEELKG